VVIAEHRRKERIGADKYGAPRADAVAGAGGCWLMLLFREEPQILLCKSRNPRVNRRSNVSFTVVNPAKQARNCAGFPPFGPFSNPTSFIIPSPSAGRFRPTGLLSEYVGLRGLIRIGFVPLRQDMFSLF